MNSEPEILRQRTDEHDSGSHERVVSWLRRIGHWLSDEESWRVIYTDSQRSRRMKRRVAKDYKEIFGGRLMFDPRKPAND